MRYRPPDTNENDPSEAEQTLPFELRVGNQTSFSASSLLDPYRFALDQGFPAFEWFPDKKGDSGWDLADMDQRLRHEVQAEARQAGLTMSVHAPWQATILDPTARAIFAECLVFCQDLGATLLNIHYGHEQGPEAFVDCLGWLVQATAHAGLKLAVENTVFTPPAAINHLFAALRRAHGDHCRHVGLCFDLGHANLCEATRNDYVGYLKAISHNVPIIHLHLHENYGTADSHLPLFTGPSGADERGVKLLLDQLRRRVFNGMAILEVWPESPSVLTAAWHRLAALAPTAVPLSRSAPAKPERHSEQKRKKTPTPGHHLPAKVGKRPTAMGALRVCPRGLLPGSADILPASCREKAGETPALPGMAIAILPLRDNVGSSGGQTRNAPTDIVAALVELDKGNLSWREKLDAVAVFLAGVNDAAFAEALAATAVYLRFVGTGAIVCQEDGRHFRPHHHAEAARRIMAILAERATPATTWLTARIAAWLPSFDRPFTRAEPLTRIRDIAHRNDIPRELKEEIKHTLQNKLHRCAGPEDLETAGRILARIESEKDRYSSEFVAEFNLFYNELAEFFNRPGLRARLAAFATHFALPDEAALITAITRRNGKKKRIAREMVAIVTEVVALTTHLSQSTPGDLDAWQARVMLAASLEDFLFTLAAEAEALLAASPHSRLFALGLSLLHPLLRAATVPGTMRQEQACIVSELDYRRLDFGHNIGTKGPVPSRQSSRRDVLLAVLALLNRTLRLAADFGKVLHERLADAAMALGSGLGLAEPAVSIFCEGEIRGHLLFQVSRIASLLAAQARIALKLPPHEIISGGTAVGRLIHLPDLAGFRRPPEQNEPVLLLADRIEGDEEVARDVAAVIIPRSIPHLSHFAIRARQEGIVLAAVSDQAAWLALVAMTGRRLTVVAREDSLTVTDDRPDGGSAASARDGARAADRPDGGSAANARDSAGAAVGQDSNVTAQPAPATVFRIAQVEVEEAELVPIAKARTATCGAKAYGLGQLAAIATEPDCPFTVKPAVVISFGAMEKALARGQDWRGYPQGALDRQQLAALRRQIEACLIDPTLGGAIDLALGGAPLMVVRSSANCEDLAQATGAGLYDSIAGVDKAGLGPAIARVWASLWTDRAWENREKYGISHDQARMAVIVQEMVPPEYSFVIHTRHPTRPDREELMVEVAVGLGETLASAAIPGSPCRAVISRCTGEILILSLADFSQAVMVVGKAVKRVAIDYSTMSLSCDEGFRAHFFGELQKIALLVESRLGNAQDIEGAYEAGRFYLLQSRPQPQ